MKKLFFAFIAVLMAVTLASCATTQTSGGLPTSPAAKAYDLLNDVTGTYNFSTFQLT